MLVSLIHKRRALLRLLAVLLLLLCGAAEGRAQQKSSQLSAGRQRFRLDRTVSVTADFEHKRTADEFAARLRSQGVMASSAYAKARQKVVFQQVNSLPGAGSDAYRITIKPRTVTVQFTSEAALERAAEVLQTSVQGQGKQKFWSGATLQEGGAARPSPDGYQRVDAAASLRSVGDLESAVKKQASGSGPVYLVLVSADRWRMPSPSLELADPARRLYPSDGCYTASQLRQIMNYGKQHRIDIVPTLELSSENAPFMDAFGHSVFSVEGMRLVRAAVEDCIEMLRPAKICLGKSSAGADRRYRDYIKELSARLGVELIVIE